MHQPTETAYGFSRPWFTGRPELLTGMSQQSVHRFNETMRTTKRRRGDWIFLLGDPADSIYLLQKGRMKLTALGEDGQEVLHEIICPGDIISCNTSLPSRSEEQTSQPHP